MTVFPSKPCTVFKTKIYSDHYGKSPEEFEQDAKGEANIQWHECSTNYKWVWENAIKGSVTFHAYVDTSTLAYHVDITAQFKPEDLTYYLMAFEVA
jgi:hypothetical protein